MNIGLNVWPNLALAKIKPIVNVRNQNYTYMLSAIYIHITSFIYIFLIGLTDLLAASHVLSPVKKTPFGRQESLAEPEPQTLNAKP